MFQRAIYISKVVIWSCPEKVAHSKTNLTFYLQWFWLGPRSICRTALLRNWSNSLKILFSQRWSFATPRKIKECNNSAMMFFFERLFVLIMQLFGFRISKHVLWTYKDFWQCQPRVIWHNSRDTVNVFLMQVPPLNKVRNNAFPSKHLLAQSPQMKH